MLLNFLLGTMFNLSVNFCESKFGYIKTMFYICTRKTKGSLAERLGTGLQNRLQQFESARNLEEAQP